MLQEGSRGRGNLLGVSRASGNTVHRDYMSYSRNSLKGGSIWDYIGEYYRAY